MSGWLTSTDATPESYGAEVTGVDDLNQTIELLLSGRIDATLNAEVTYYDYLAAHPEADIVSCEYSEKKKTGGSGFWGKLFG